jgi:TonB family protein
MIVLALGIMAGCGSLTSRENAKLITDFEDMTDYDTPPVLVKTVRPDYPEIIKEVGTGGKVVLKALVLEDGSIGAVQIMESPNDVLANEAITALRLSEFAPARKDGRPCCATTLIPFMFDKDEVQVRSSSGLEERDQEGMVDRTYPVDRDGTDGPVTPSK